MFIIITYDIKNDKKRTGLYKRLKDFGPRVQYSVFEADITVKEMEKLKAVLEKVELDVNDSIRLYQLCESCLQKIVIWGEGEVTQDKDYYIV